MKRQKGLSNTNTVFLIGNEYTSIGSNNYIQSAIPLLTYTQGLGSCVYSLIRIYMKRQEREKKEAKKNDM
jgi:hypothetical protein